MDKGTYQYTDLADKYEDFSAPGCEITLAGKELPGISQVDVELTADGTASGCSFSLDAGYDLKNSCWDKDLIDLVEPGAKLVIKGGYVKKKELFYGYLDDYSLEFSSDGAPHIRIGGIDGLGFLMSNREPLYAGQRKTAEIVKGILNKAVSAGFAKSVTVGTLTDFETPLVKEQVDDWRFLTLMARRYGASLLVVDGEMIFDTAIDNDKEILALTLGVGLNRFSKRVSLAHQVGKVEIYGRDVNQKPIQGTASSVTVGGSGKSAAQMVSAFKDACLREYSEFARTQNECQKLAQNRLNSLAMDFVSGEGECVGIPELIPGRYLKIEGSDSHTNGLYFLTKVRHSFSEAGYTTSFEFKGAKL